MQKNLLRRGRVAAALGTVLLAMTAAACSNSSSTSSDPGSGSSSSSQGDAAASKASANLAKYSKAWTSYPSITPLANVAKLKGKTVWYVPFGSGVPILTAFGDAMGQALSKAGVNLHVCDGKYLPTTMSACLQQAATQGANAVVTGYIDYLLMPNAFANLVSHNIPVLLAGTPPESGKTSDTKLAFFDTTDEVNLEDSLAADKIIAESKGSAKILYVGLAEPQSFVAQSATLKQYVAKACPGCSLNEITYTAAGIQKLPSQVSAALLSHPDTDYVLTQVDAAAGPAISGIQSASMTNKVKLVSSNGQLDAMQRLASGGVQIADVGVSPAYDGWSFADGILRMMVGQKVEQRIGVVRVFTGDNIKGLALTPANYTTNAWYGDNSYQGGFLKAWGLTK